MKIRTALFSCLFVLSACSSSTDDGGDAGSGANGGNGNSSNGGSGNSSNGGSGNSSNGGSGNSSNGGSGNSSNGGSGNSSNGGNGGSGNSSNGGNGDSGNGGDGGSGGNVIATSCGMPVPNASTGNTCYNAPPPALKLTEIVAPDADGELFAPLLLSSPPGDDRLFVIVRSGFIRIIKDGSLLPEPFLDITGETTNNNGENEHGLIGMAFDPDFANNNKVWIHYNQPDMTSTIASVLVSDDDPDVADAGSLHTLLEIAQPYDNHKGGMLAFGRDGCLYASFGDGGSGDDPGGRGQKTDEPLASMLRLDTQNYPTMAPGNPGFMDDRVWSYGYRNPWRFSFDKATGDIYVGDVGQNNWEEVDIEPAGTGNFNYGWDVLEGKHAHEGEPDANGKRMPAIEYDHTGGQQSITGGYVYRGTAIPNMVGRYIYADFKSNRFWTLTYSGETDGQPQACDQYELTQDIAKPQNAGGVTAFGQDAHGELYVLTINGGIYRIDAE